MLSIKKEESIEDSKNAAMSAQTPIGNHSKGEDMWQLFLAAIIASAVFAIAVASIVSDRKESSRSSSWFIDSNREWRSRND